MPRLTCICGQQINLSALPNPQGFILIWEPFIEPLIDRLVEASEEAESSQEFENKVYSLFYPKAPRYLQVYECPKCGRLILFSDISNIKPMYWFKREEIVDQHNVKSIQQFLQPFKD